MGEKAERDNRAKACKWGRANICAHCGTCQPPSWDPPASSRPNSGVCVWPHAQHVCTCVFMHLYTVEHGARRGSHWALPGPNALGGAAAGPGHGARRGSAGFRRGERPGAGTATATGPATATGTGTGTATGPGRGRRRAVSLTPMMHRKGSPGPVLPALPARADADVRRAGTQPHRPGAACCTPPSPRGRQRAAAEPRRGGGATSAFVKGRPEVKPGKRPAASPSPPPPARPPARPPAAVPYLGSHAVPGAATPSRPFPSSAPLPSDRGTQLPRLRTSPPAPAVTARSHREGWGAAPARPRRGPVIARHGPGRPCGLRAGRRARPRETRPRAERRPCGASTASSPWRARLPSWLLHG